MTDPDLKMENLLKFFFIKTDDQEAFVGLDEVLKLWNGSKRRQEVQAAVISTLQVQFVQTSGHKERSPRGKFVGLRQRKAEERLELINVVISVGTAFEADNLQEVLEDREDVMGEDLIDVQRIITGHVGYLAIAILQPTTRGPMPQYGAMRQMLKLCPNANHFYKTGGMAGPFDMGVIIVAAEGQESVVVEDDVLNKQWKTRPGFPGPDLWQVAFQSKQPTRQETVSTGAELIEVLSPKPYEIELSGFLTALDRHGAFTEKNQIGFVGVITDNFDIHLKKKSKPECFQDLISFWRFFLANLQ